jgi:hypothetical protein
MIAKQGPLATGFRHARNGWARGPSPAEPEAPATPADPDAPPRVIEPADAPATPLIPPAELPPSPLRTPAIPPPPAGGTPPCAAPLFPPMTPAVPPPSRFSARRSLTPPQPLAATAAPRTWTHHLRTRTSLRVAGARSSARRRVGARPRLPRGEAGFGVHRYTTMVYQTSKPW